MSQLLKKIIISGKTRCLSGLHIGGTNLALGIGGPDNVVIRNPIDNKPYIPGSSLKGKMRSLIEQKDNTMTDANMGSVKKGPGSDASARSVQLFGAASKKLTRPSRAIVRDGFLLSGDEMFKNTDMAYTENKTEVVIDRVTSAANPRQLERVPAGAEFGLEIVLNVFDSDDELLLMNTLMEALKLLTDDYLGGSGSRGSGQVAFFIDTIEERNAAYYRGEGEATDITNKYLEQIEVLKREMNPL